MFANLLGLGVAFDQVLRSSATNPGSTLLTRTGVLSDEDLEQAVREDTDAC
jgi:hypothetical protein